MIARMRAHHRSWLAVLTLGLALAGCSVQAQPQSLRFSGAQLTKQLEGSFPWRQCLLADLACVVLRSPVLQMRKGDPRLYVEFDAQFLAAGQSLGQGTAQVAGVPRYDKSQGAFFIAKGQLLDLQIEGLPATQSRLAAQLLTEVLADELSRHPIWVLDESDPKQAMARLTLRQVRVSDGYLVLDFGDEDPKLEEEPSTDSPAVMPNPRQRPFSAPVEHT